MLHVHIPCWALTGHTHSNPKSSKHFTQGFILEIRSEKVVKLLFTIIKYEQRVISFKSTN